MGVCDSAQISTVTVVVASQTQLKAQLEKTLILGKEMAT